MEKSAQTPNTELEIALLLLEKLNEVGIALSTEKNLSILMERILMAAKEITNAEGGTMYLADSESKFLTFEIMVNDVLHTHFGGTGTDLPPFPKLPIYDESGRVNESLIAAYAAGYRKKVNVKDAYLEKGFDFRGTKAFDARNKYRSKSFLTIPMLDAKGELLGVLQLINPREPSGTLRTFTTFDEQMVESLTSQASVSFSNRKLLDETRKLFEAMIDMINLALDEKSPYTNKHCQRVPIITMMLANAVVDFKDGPLADFYLNEEEKDELRIAALLHDCGKIVTPVHVIDKSKKLELLGDEFERVYIRADAVRKQLEVEAYRRGSLQPLDDEKYVQDLADLEADLLFLKQTNVGSESVDDKVLERMRNINARWIYDINGQKHPLLDSKELDYLSIRYGTLSPEERQIINYHVTASIKMLNSLPWPAHLKHVPEYAGGHHERMDGKGYPKGLVGSQMSIPARIMGIADIFEALTAQDRPYKQPKKLSESLKIMDHLANSGHIDPELYKVFIAQKVYLEYAKKYLNPEQIDAVSHEFVAQPIH